MFALEWCEFCWAVRKLFARLGIAYQSVDIDSVAMQAGDMGAKIRAVAEATHRLADDPADLHRRHAHRRLHRPVRRDAGGPHAAAARRRRCRATTATPTSIPTACCPSGCIRARPRDPHSRSGDHERLRTCHCTSASSTARNRGRAIDEACRDWGFFQVTGHGIDQSVLDEIFAMSRAFFAQPAADKRRILRDADNPWGFFDKELTKNRQDWKEIYDYGPDGGDGRAPRWPDGPLRPRFEAGRARLLRQLHDAGACACCRRSRRTSASARRCWRAASTAHTRASCG